MSGSDPPAASCSPPVGTQATQLLFTPSFFFSPRSISHQPSLETNTCLFVCLFSSQLNSVETLTNIYHLLYFEICFYFEDLPDCVPLCDFLSSLTRVACSRLLTGAGWLRRSGRHWLTMAPKLSNEIVLVLKCN